MGNGNVKYIDPVRVAKVKGKYPPVLPPKWLLSDICRMVKMPPLSGTTDVSQGTDFDWDALERLIEAEIEDGIDNVETVPTRPPSVATARIDTGMKKHRQQLMKRVGQKARLSFQLVDKHARQATAKNAASFDDLLSYLKQPIDGNLYPQTCLARALTIWFAGQGLGKANNEVAPLDTPLGIVQNARNQVISYTEAFTLLCRNSDIPTAIITGPVKAGRYEPGDAIGDGASDMWCAVHVDGAWQIIHPLWVCRGTYGPEKPGYVQIDSDPFLAASVAKAYKQDKNAIILNDEFFMPRPDVFLYRCYADDPQWHLMPKQNNSLKSIEEFTKLAYISAAFFKFGLTLRSVPYCVQKAINGMVYIEILAPREHAHRLNLGYQIEADAEDPESSNLSAYHQQPQLMELFQRIKARDKLLQKKILNTMVINYRSNDRFIFEIRLPLPGSYKFVITGGFGSDLYTLCRFRLISTDPIREWFVAPVEPGKDGWGPGPRAENVGLLLPNKPSGLLSIPPKAHSGVLRDRTVYHHLTTVSFHINRALYKKYEFSCEILPFLFLNAANLESKFQPNGDIKPVIQPVRQRSNEAGDSNEPPDDVFPVCVQSMVDPATRQLIIQVLGRLDGGECALLISATEMEIKNNIRVPKKGSTRPVCYYLLTANTASQREVTQVKLVKASLQEALEGEDIDRIQAAVDKCLKTNIPRTNDDVAAAEAKLEYLRLRKEMLDCVKRRNVSIVTEALKKVVAYRYREALVSEVEKLLAFRSQLIPHEGYPRDLPTKRDALEELFKIPGMPSKTTHNTMQALCTMLGYDGDLGDWRYIHTKLKVTHESSGDWTMLRRMEFMEGVNFPWHDMDVDVLDRTHAILHKYPYEKVLHGNQAAATVFKWVDRMLSIAKEYLRQQLTE